MTTDQLEYWKLQEQIRSNTAREQETHRSNVAKEDLQQQEIYETLRHNLTDEQIREALASLEKDKFDLSYWKTHQENTRDWIDKGFDWFYMVFSKMPKDATEGFANWGKGMSAIKGK